MRVETKRWLELDVLRADHDGDIYIRTPGGCFYIHKDDILALIKALKWASQERKQ